MKTTDEELGNCLPETSPFILTSEATGSSIAWLHQEEGEEPRHDMHGRIHGCRHETTTTTHGIAQCTVKMSRLPRQLTIHVKRKAAEFTVWLAPDCNHRRHLYAPSILLRCWALQNAVDIVSTSHHSQAHMFPTTRINLIARSSQWKVQSWWRWFSAAMEGASPCTLLNR